MTLKNFIKNKIDKRTPVVVLFIIGLCKVYSIGLHKVSPSSDIVSWLDYVLVGVEAVILLIISETIGIISSKYNAVYRANNITKDKKIIFLATHSIYIFVSFTIAISIIYNLVKGVYIPSQWVLILGSVIGLTFVIINIFLSFKKIHRAEKQ